MVYEQVDRAFREMGPGQQLRALVGTERLSRQPCFGRVEPAVDAVERVPHHPAGLAHRVIVGQVVGVRDRVDDESIPDHGSPVPIRTVAALPAGRR